MQDIMLDLETKSSTPDAVVLSIGATAFDTKYVEAIGFYTVPELKRQEELGRVESKDTMDWWAKQSAEARQVFSEPQTELVEALNKMVEYMAKQAPMGSIRVWSNGADFDLPIITSLMQKAGVAVPWKFYNHRCYRTLKGLVPKGVYDMAWKNAQQLFGGPGHNALVDAKRQAKAASDMLAYVEGMLRA